MELLFDPLQAVLDFLETGGIVLWAILGVSVVLWTLILERYWFLRWTYPSRVRIWTKQWQARGDKTSWRAHRIRDGLLSEANQQLSRTLPLIKTLIGICPLLGLLGTVTGMILVFDVISLLGTGNARAMASGVWRATVPTMAGLIAALAGLMLSSRLDHDIRQQNHRLATQLKLK